MSVRLRDQAIAALLRGRTVKEAAEELGIGYTTLKSWTRNNELFRAAYEEAKRLLLDETVNQLRTAGGEGVAALRDVANNSANPPAARASAARGLLEVLLRAVETQDLAARLEKLERDYNNEPRL